MNQTDKTEEQSMSLDHRVVDAEVRVNLIRICAIAGFYLIHLWHVAAPGLNEQAAALIGLDANHPVPPNVHLGVTVLCLGWLLQAFAVHLMIAQRRVPEWLVLSTTFGDLGWLTAVLCLSTGPGGPMVAGYFLIIMLSGVRFDLRLVRVTTVCTVISYLALLGVARWPFGIAKETGLETVPRYHQLMVLIAIILSGVIIGQIVRHAYLISDSPARTRTGEEA